MEVLTTLVILLAAASLVAAIVGPDRAWGWLTRREGQPYVVDMSSFPVLEEEPVAGPWVKRALKQNPGWGLVWVKPYEVESKEAEGWKLVRIGGWRRRRIEHRRRDEHYHLMVRHK